MKLQEEIIQKCTNAIIANQQIIIQEKQRIKKLQPQADKELQTYEKITKIIKKQRMSKQLYFTKNHLKTLQIIRSIKYNIRIHNGIHNSFLKVRAAAKKTKDLDNLHIFKHIINNGYFTLDIINVLPKKYLKNKVCHLGECTDAYFYRIILKVDKIDIPILDFDIYCFMDIGIGSYVKSVFLKLPIKDQIFLITRFIELNNNSNSCLSNFLQKIPKTEEIYNYIAKLQVFA